MAKLTKAGYARAKAALGLKGKLTRAQSKRVFKKAIKSLGRKTTSRSSKSKKSSPKTKSKKSSSRKGGNRMGKRNITTTVYKWIRIGALAAPAVSRVFEPIEPKEKIERIIQDYTGYNINDREFRFDYLARGWMPYIGAVLTTYGIPKLASIIRRL